MSHQPVLLQETLEALQVHPQGTYLDATVGAGGHAREIAKRLRSGVLVALDRDPQALERARQALAPYRERVRLHRANFVALEAVLRAEGVAALDGALFDLGVSSLQLDTPERGFSFRQEGPLDMRMGPDAPRTAAEVVNRAPAAELERIFREYGQERFARRIAQAIVAQRTEHGPLHTTAQLARLIERAVPGPARRRSRIHPATRAFQALRIAVNEELEAIPVALEAAFAALKPGGHLAVIAFHSLEDRLVKRFMRAKAQGCACPPGLPRCACGGRPQARLEPLVRPSPEEVAANPRARSARLRVAHKR